MKKFAFVFFLFCIATTAQKNQTPIPDSCRQLIVVTTSSVESNQGVLKMYERENTESDWFPFYTEPVFAGIGEKGLAWGKGIHELTDEMTPHKMEVL